VLHRWCDFLNQTRARNDPLWVQWHTLATRSSKDVKTAAAALARQWAETLAAADSPTPHADPRQEALRRVLRGPDAPPDVPLADFDAVRTADDQGKVETSNLAIAALWARYADAGGPKRAMAVEDAS